MQQYFFLAINSMENFNIKQKFRCKSTHNRLPNQSKYNGKHRNSAPTTFSMRTPTPQIEIFSDAEEEYNFSKFYKFYLNNF